MVKKNNFKKKIKQPTVKKGKKIERVREKNTAIVKSELKHSSKDSFKNYLETYLKDLFIILVGLKKNFLLWWEKFRIKELFKKIFIKDLKVKVVSLLVSLSIFGYVKMQDIEERRIFIPLSLDKIEELELVTPPPEKIGIYLSGSRTMLAELNVNQLRANVDLSDISEEGSYIRKPVIEGLPKDVQLLNVSPNTINFELSFLQQRPLKVEPELVGKLNSNFEIKFIRTSPKRVNVLGPRDILKDINKILTEPIDVEGLKGDKEVEVLLSRNIHPTIKVDLERKIKVNISVRSKYFKEKIKDIFLLNVNLSDQESLISYDFISISNVEYKISISDVENFDPNEEIEFFVDTKAIQSPGLYTLPVTYVKKSSFKILDYSPKKVEIKVEKVDNEKKQSESSEETDSSQNESLYDDDEMLPEEDN